jgi:predicted acyl esterase
MLYQQTRRSFWRRHKLMTAAAVVLVAWMLMSGWYTTVAAAGLVVSLIAVHRHRSALAIRNAGLRARADYEHRLSLAGDPRGVFGRYPPVRI